MSIEMLTRYYARRPYFEKFKRFYRILEKLPIAGFRQYFTIKDGIVNIKSFQQYHGRS